MTTLHRRVADLEQKNTPEDQLSVFLRRFAYFGESGPVRFLDGEGGCEAEPIGFSGGNGLDWHRREGESLEDLRARAAREAPRGINGVAVLRGILPGELAQGV